jgi:excisionase family DNA binding protein
MSDYLTTAEVAELLDVPRAAIRYWRFTGHGPAWVRHGLRLRCPRADLLAWLAADQRARTGE